MSNAAHSAAAEHYAPIATARGQGYDLLRTDHAVRLLEAYQDCTPAHRELLIKLAEVLATNRALKASRV